MTVHPPSTKSWIPVTKLTTRPRRGRRRPRPARPAVTSVPRRSCSRTPRTTPGTARICAVSGVSTMPGAIGVDAHALLPQLDGRRPQQLHEPGLRRGVDALPGLDRHRTDRAEPDDAAAPPLGHARPERPHEVERGAQVERHDPVELLSRCSRATACAHWWPAVKTRTSTSPSSAAARLTASPSVTSSSYGSSVPAPSPCCSSPVPSAAARSRSAHTTVRAVCGQGQRASRPMPLPAPDDDRAPAVQPEHPRVVRAHRRRPLVTAHPRTCPSIPPTPSRRSLAGPSDIGFLSG